MSKERIIVVSTALLDEAKSRIDSICISLGESFRRSWEFIFTIDYERQKEHTPTLTKAKLFPQGWLDDI